MTYTKQPRSLPVVDKNIIENTDSSALQPLRTDSPEVEELRENLLSIHCGLNTLYTKLIKLNAVIEQHKEQDKGEESEN